MGEYYVTYKGRTQEGIHINFEVEYFKQNPTSGQLEKDFSLVPFVQLNKQMGNVSEPSTRHYFNRDIYTHVTYAEMEDAKAVENTDGYREGKSFELKPGDTITTSNSLIVLEGLSKDVDRKKFMIAEDDIAVSARLLVMDVNRKLYRAEPVFILRDSVYFNRPDELADLGLRFTFEKVLPEENKVKILIAEKEGNSRDFIIMKAIIFPHINLLWIGCILLAVGTWIAVVRRLRESRQDN
jgi:cytochrome c-type biogenesis protein CcmF